MKVAVTYEEGKIFQHFGHTERFKIYEIENNEVVTGTIVNTNGSGHGALPDVLKKLGVESLICGGIGGGAKTALSQAGIKLYGGATGDADEAVKALLAGTLKFNSDATCNHHGEGHSGAGGHDCGSHHHGEGHACGSHQSQHQHGK